MSLTKATFLKAASVDKPELLGEFFGEDLYVRCVTEFQRSHRMASLYKASQDGSEAEAMTQARAFTVIDHVCDAKGKPVFNTADLKHILDLDAAKIDTVITAIEKWNEGKLGK